MTTKSFLGYLIVFFFLTPICLFAQPIDLPWSVDPDCNSIITTGITAATCGVTTTVPAAERFTLGLIDMNGALPAVGRVDVTLQQDMYHHPSWHIDSIGNVFGIAMDFCGNTYVTASANYGTMYFGNEAVINFGAIGGGDGNPDAAGTVYKIDSITAQASVFSVLPQQSYTYTHQACESFNPIPRTGAPGLGNIAFNPACKQFYVSNFEDGRIYRIDTLGEILASYDPFALDNGLPGPADIETELVYGLAVSNSGSQLFFGTVDTSELFSSAFSPQVWAIDLDEEGAFMGAVDNTMNPAGSTWDNYVGPSTLHFTFNLPSTSGANVLSISDLAFSSEDKLIVGLRSGCEFTIFSSYNHDGHTQELSLNPATDLYELNPMEIYTSVWSIGETDAYGGVATFDNPAGGIEYMITSSDMLEEVGPHGFCTVPAGSYGMLDFPAGPSGLISYQYVDDNFTDPKGVGGDVEVFKACDCRKIIIEDTPVELLYFKGEKLDRGNHLTWGTAIEYNNSHFTLEKSIDGAGFEYLAEFEGAGNSTEELAYEFIDQLAIEGTIYYRLKQTDFDGQSEVFSIISLERSPTVGSLTLFPNPVRNQINLNIEMAIEQSLEVQILSTKGAMMHKESFDLKEGFNTISMSSADLEEGFYFYQLIGPLGILHQDKFWRSK